MADFQQKRKIKKAVYSKISLVILLVIIIPLAHATYGIYQKEQLSSVNFNSAKKEYDDLKAREDMLNSEIGRLQTDEGIEEDIRNKFSVAKPGEQVIVIFDKEGTSSVENHQKESFWQKLVSFFK